MTTPTSLSSKAWHFGRNWPGKRCLARTRRGTPCQKPAITGTARCQLHGARGGAPSGRANGNYRSGEFTKEQIAGRRAQAAQFKAMVEIGRLVGYFR